MFRLLLWIAIIAAAFWLWRRFKRPAKANASTKAEAQPTPMVRCAHCQVHLPQEQALQQNQQWYCSQAHLPKDEQRP